MSTTGRIFCGLVRSNVGKFNKTPPSTVSVRLVAQSSPPPEDQVNNQPIKFSTSKASHRTWKVSRSMGSQHRRPWWKVVPISLVGGAFLLWCVLRKETDIDAQLEKQLHEQLPGFISDSEKADK